MLDSLDALYLFRDPCVMLQHLKQCLGAQLDIVGLLAEENEEVFLTRHQPLQ